MEIIHSNSFPDQEAVLAAYSSDEEDNGNNHQHTQIHLENKLTILLVERTKAIEKVKFKYFLLRQMIDNKNFNYRKNTMIKLAKTTFKVLGAGLLGITLFKFLKR